MSSQREVLIRMLALLQRKTLIEIKNRTVKCLKWHYSTVRSMKNVAVLTEDRAFASFFVRILGDLTAKYFPPPAKKIPMPGGQPGGWALLELTDE